MKNKCKILGAKSIMALVLCFCMLFTLAPISVSAYETIEDLNLIAGRPISFKNHNVKNYTFYNNGVTYIPLRMTSQMCGFAVMWDAQTNGISITKAGKFIKCNPVDDNYVVGSQNIKLGGAPVLVEGTTFVPESFISNVLGLQFTSSWNGISIYDGEELSCTITDISLEHDDDDGEKWMRVQTDDYGIKRVDVTGTQFYKCKFNDLNIGDMLEISLKCAYSDSEWLAATVTRISEADEDGNISFDGSILSVSKSTIKIEVDKDTTLTLKLTDDTKIKYKGSSRKLDYKDLEEEMEVYGYYEYTSKNKGNCLSLTIGKSNGSSSSSKYDDDDDDNETGEEISFKGAKVKNFTDDYVTIIWEDETIKLTIDDDTMLRDADNHNSRIDLDDFEYEGDMYCRGSYEYRSSTKGLAYMLYFTTDSSEYDKYYDEDGDYRGDDDDDDDRYDDRYDDDRDDDYDYEEGEEIDFRDIEVLEVKGSYIVVDFDGIEMKWYYDEDETEVEQKGSSRECDFEDIEEGMEIEGYFEYRSLTKGILLYVELPDEDDYDYDDRYDDDRYDDDRYDDRDGYEKGDKVSFDEAELLEVSSDYIVLDIDGKEVKLTIDEDTTVRYGSKTITDVTARKFKSYIGEYLSGTYKFVSSTKGTAIRVTFEDVEEDDDDYDDYEDYEDEDYDEDYVEGIITKVSGSYILVEDDDEDEYKLYVDSDTKVKYQGKSREYTIDDLEKGMEVEVDFYERSSSKLQATKVVVLD